MLPAAHRAAAEAGVTRLADVTRLDRIGFPVWQAVRPMSRSLSVHQGKGADAADAQLGALLEAVESHWAESFDAPGPVSRFADLPADERAPDFADFALHRHRPPPEDESYRWVEARDLLTGGRLHLPFDLVSLDFTRPIAGRIECASNGVATGSTREEAILTALHELIERDSVIEWQARGLIHCSASVLRTETVPFDWLHFWIDRLRSAGVTARLYAVPSLTGSPVLTCELDDPSADIAAYRANGGYGCHHDPELALFRALAEAIQGRATYIAGAREDLYWFYRKPVGGAFARFGLPLGEGLDGVAWDAVAPGPANCTDLAKALESAGYDRIAVLDLARPEGLHVVRAFVCGLGSTSRRRRAPA